ncbi:MAG: Ala-tRNA(Pro) hydrolase [Dehalococcoidia bacterium]|nr:Ala-tRNA(Pro) hydrolase [Dehalococcoidia bacterium]MQG15327.1 alanyl-tRNA editing protein [SAR202 cluster bacterium]
MTHILAHIDAYQKSMKSIVNHVLPEGVELKETIFYPGGGGQPSDSGVLRFDGNEIEVQGVKRIGNQLIHLTNGVKPVLGQEIEGVIDWDRRYQLMRTHTALHILCGVIWRDFGVQVTGGNMKPLEARMDFELEEMSADFASIVQRAIDIEVDKKREVTVKFLPREQAFKIPDLIRTKINLLPANIEEVRIVEIKGLDIQADGGTHVANTSDVGSITIVGHESKGKRNKRLRIRVGDLEKNNDKTKD